MKLKDKSSLFNLATMMSVPASNDDTGRKLVAIRITKLLEYFRGGFHKRFFVHLDSVMSCKVGKDSTVFNEETA